MKCQPDYSGKFNSAEHSWQWCDHYYQWANFKHNHSGLNGYTPHQVFTGTFQEVAKIEQDALDARFLLNPERFVHGRPRVKMPPTEVAINPITDDDIANGEVDNVNFPTLHAAGYVSNAHYFLTTCPYEV